MEQRPSRHPDHTACSVGGRSASHVEARAGYIFPHPMHREDRTNVIFPIRYIGTTKQTLFSSSDISERPNKRYFLHPIYREDQTNAIFPIRYIGKTKQTLFSPSSRSAHGDVLRCILTERQPLDASKWVGHRRFALCIKQPPISTTNFHQQQRFQVALARCVNADPRLLSAKCKSAMLAGIISILMPSQCSTTQRIAKFNASCACEKNRSEPDVELLFS